jgi:type I restriction enzyme S subunit
MDAQSFLENFATIAEAPGGVQRLRDLVRDLAVTGRLVKQDPDEGHGRTLLANIADRRSVVVATNKGRALSHTPTAEISPTFSVPSSWAWAAMHELHMKMGAGSTPKGGQKVYVGSGVAFLRSQNVWNDGLRLNGVARIPNQVHNRMAGTAVRPGDVLLNITGASIGRSCVVPEDFDEDANVSQHVAILRQIDNRTNPWIHLFLISPHGFREIMSEQVGISREGLSMKRLAEFAVPVPPLPEQFRILARVQELIGLCDELDARHGRRDRATTRFRASGLHAVTEAETTDDVRHAWERVSSNWPALVSHPDGVPALRATVLALALRGRLVAQNPKDGSATGLLPPDHSPIDDPPYPIPSTWEWARFGEIADSRLGKMLDQAKNAGPLRPYLRNANVQWFRFDLGDIHELRLEDRDYEAHSLRVGDLVICEGGEPGRAAVCDAEVEGMVFQKALHRARPRDGVDVWYLAYMLRSTSANGRLARYFTGATIKHLTGRSLGTFPVPLPPSDEQTRIVAVIESALKECDEIERRLRVRGHIEERLAASATARMSA